MKLVGESAYAAGKKLPNTNISVTPTAAVPVIVNGNRCMVRSPSIVEQFSLIRLHY
jgi:hypothetical protein